jgi:HlyD family secretion protein
VTTRRKRWVKAAGLTAVLGIAGSVYYTSRTVEAAPVPSTAPVTRGDVVQTISATGTLQAVTTVQVGTQVSGTIQALYADFNAIVRRGDLVARLDPSLFETQIAQARASLVRAEADVERLRVGLEDAVRKRARTADLWTRQIVSQVDVEAAEVAVRLADAQVRSAEAQVTQARASLNQQEVNLTHTLIHAPIDGIVVSRNVDVGQTVAASTQAPTIFVLAADLAEMQVMASLDESDIGRIAADQSVRFTVDAYPGVTFTGRVAQVRLQPQTVQNVVTYDTVIAVGNPDLRLKPGMTANVTIETARRDGVLRVPNAALRFRPAGSPVAMAGEEGDVDGHVWVAEGTTLRPVGVQLGLSDGQVTEILGSDLAPGAAVVTAMSAGGAVRPVAGASAGTLSIFSAGQGRRY